MDYLEPLTADTSKFDSLSSVSAEAREKYGIVRFAKIGAGKKNVHFENYGASPCHDAMVSGMGRGTTTATTTTTTATTTTTTTNSPLPRPVNPTRLH